MDMGIEQLLPILLKTWIPNTTSARDEEMMRTMKDILDGHSSRTEDKNYKVIEKLLEVLEKSTTAKDAQEKEAYKAQVEELNKKLYELMKDKQSTSRAPQQEESETNPPNDGDEVKKIYQMLKEMKADMRRGKQQQNRGAGAFAKFNKQSKGGEWKTAERTDTPRHDHYRERGPFPHQSEASGGFSELIGNKTRPHFENPGFPIQYDQSEFIPRFEKQMRNYDNNDNREFRPGFHLRGRGFRRGAYTRESSVGAQNEASNIKSNFARQNRPHDHSSEDARINVQKQGQFHGRGRGMGRGNFQGRGQFHKKVDSHQKDSSHENQGHVKKDFKQSNQKQGPQNVKTTAEVDVYQLFMKLQQQMKEQKKGQNSQQTTKTAVKVKTQQVKHKTETNAKPQSKATTKPAGDHASEGNKTKKTNSSSSSGGGDKGAKKKQNTNNTPKQNSSSSNLSLNIQFSLGEK